MRSFVAQYHLTPASATILAGRLPEETAPADALHGLRLLIVEDDDDGREIIEEVLRTPART